MAVALTAAFVCSSILILYMRQSHIAGNSIWPAVGVAALCIGRWEERTVALVIALAIVATRLAMPHDLAAPRYGVLMVDMVEDAALLIIALRSSLWWPTLCAGCHLAALSNHAIFMLRPAAVDPWTYVSGLLVWSWLGFVPLVFGTLDAWAARRAVRPA